MRYFQTRLPGNHNLCYILLRILYYLAIQMVYHRILIKVPRDAQHRLDVQELKNPVTSISLGSAITMLA